MSKTQSSPGLLSHQLNKTNTPSKKLSLLKARYNVLHLHRLLLYPCFCDQFLKCRKDQSKALCEHAWVCSCAQREPQNRVSQSHCLLGYRHPLSKSLKVNASPGGQLAENRCISLHRKKGLTWNCWAAGDVKSLGIL